MKRPDSTARPLRPDQAPSSGRVPCVYMPHQASFRGVETPAIRTLERFFRLMRFFVCIQIGRPGECTLAPRITALERPFTRMNPQMVSQVAQAGIRLVAVCFGAWIQLFRLLMSVSAPCHQIRKYFFTATFSAPHHTRMQLTKAPGTGSLQAARYPIRHRAGPLPTPWHKGPLTTFRRVRASDSLVSNTDFPPDKWTIEYLISLRRHHRLRSTLT